MVVSSTKELRLIVTNAGFERVDLHILAFGWLLAAWARKPAATR